MTETTATTTATEQTRRRPRPVDLMTDADADALRALSPNNLIDLPADRLPCATCGVATAPPKARSAVIYTEAKSYKPDGSRYKSTRVALGHCDACSALSAHALALVAAHPRLIAALGSSHRALEAAEGIVNALSLLGQPLPDADVDDKRLGMLVRNLGTAGLAMRYRSAVTPSKANPHPWAHVRSTDRENLRARYAAALAERVAHNAAPVKIVPPPFDPYEVTAGAQPVGDACGICGVGHVEVPAVKVMRSGGRESVARSTWTLHGTIAPASLGAAASPARLLIWLCPVCEDAARWVGSMGPSTLERALFAHLDRLGSLGPNVEVPGLIGWAGLWANAVRRARPLPQPNAVPWDHVQIDRSVGGSGDQPLPGEAV